jgi:hypothetical protein
VVLKRIGEAQLELGENVRPRVNWNGPPEHLRHWTKLVDSVAVVAVRMRDNHAAQRAYVGGKQLLTQIGAAIDQQPFVSALHQDG